MAVFEASAAEPVRVLGLTLTPERMRVYLLSFALFAFTFSMYWFLGPKETSYGYQVQQANNIIHGHLNLEDEYTPTIGVLERVLYDGEGFCFPEDNPRGVDEVDNPRITPDCKTYMQHALGPAFMVIPGVLIWGVELNQTLVSAVIGAMVAPLVFAIARTLSRKLYTQLAMTALMMFGTIFFWAASNGGVWMFAHTTATLFLFAAIYFTLVRPSTLMAGVCLGAAFMCRQTTIVTGLFFVIMFANLWLRPAEPGKSLRERINFEPIANFVAGISPFIFATFLVNYLRFDSPFESGYNYGEQVHQRAYAGLYEHGTLNPRYIPEHPPVVLEAMPIFDKPDTPCGEYDCAWIRPSYAGTAVWVTTPPFLLGLLTGINNRRVLWPAAAAIILSCLFLISRGVARAYDSDWATKDPPFGIEYLPFWLAIGAAVLFAFRNSDRLVLACWAAIIPTALVIFSFAATGYAQFGYRYALDFTPFLWLLVARFVGDSVRWYVWPLLLAAVVFNLGGFLYYYQFQPDHQWGVEWLTF